MMNENESRAMRNVSRMIAASGMGFNDISRKCGISAQSVSNCLGRVYVAKCDTLMKLCDGMGWDFDSVIGVGKAPNEAHHDNFRDNMKEMMDRNGESVCDVSKATGLKADTVYRWINGTYVPSLNGLVSICLHWKVRPESMMR